MSDFYEKNNASANDMLEQIIKETEHYPMSLIEKKYFAHVSALRVWRMLI